VINTKEIKLLHGEIAIVDDEYYEELSKHNWHLNTNGHAKRGHRVNGKYTNIFMHHQIITPPKGYFVDHINGNKLDNRRENLRICTPQQNVFNLHKDKPKGVYHNKEWDTWIAYITFNQVRCYLGSYKTEREAAITYNEAAKELFGEFAWLNKV
jgi:hypothetical protein